MHKLCVSAQVARSLPEVRERQVDTINSVSRGRVNVVFIAVKQPNVRRAAEQVCLCVCMYVCVCVCLLVCLCVGVCVCVHQLGITWTH